MIKLLSFSLIFLATFAAYHQTHQPHLYYSMEEARFFTNSQAENQVTKCKNWCLSMNHHYPKYQFMFHRLVLRKGATELRYIQGTCHAKSYADTKYMPWSGLPRKDKRWREYNILCQNPQLRLPLGMIKSLGFNTTHSNFQYYDSGKFINKEPFDDLPQLLKRVLGGGKQFKRKAHKYF